MSTTNLSQDNFKFCSDCGKKISKNAITCPECGSPANTENLTTNNNGNKKNDYLTVLLLCLFCGYLGVHRFYSGHTAIGVIQLLTVGGCGIWWFIDFIIIISGNYKDNNGNPIKSS